eukprot:3941353-Rhodomonas_salina.3
MHVRNPGQSTRSTPRDQTRSPRSAGRTVPDRRVLCIDFALALPPRVNSSYRGNCTDTRDTVGAYA